MDTRAVQHILTQSMIYQKPPQVTAKMSRFLGEGEVYGVVARLSDSKSSSRFNRC